jgi:hypothetical protein
MIKGRRSFNPPPQRRTPGPVVIVTPEMERLRAELAAVNAERDALKEELEGARAAFYRADYRRHDAQRWAAAWKGIAKYFRHFGVQPYINGLYQEDEPTPSAPANDPLEDLVGMVTQHCTMPDGTLDSCALSANADAMRTLADAGKLIITDEYGRRVIGKWADVKP